MFNCSKMLKQKRAKTRQDVKIHLEAKQSERFLEDYIIITSLTLWGIETATSSIRALTPKTLNFRKYKNRWRWSLEFKIRESESTRTLLCPEVAPSLCFLTDAPCSHHTYFPHCLEGDVQNRYLFFFKIAGLALVPSWFRQNP